MQPHEPDAGAPEEFIGLDIGGSKTHGILWRGSVVAAEAKAGSANVQNVSAAEASDNLAQLFAELGGRRVGTVIAGSGGIDTEDDAARLRGLIRPFAPGADIDVVHDTRLILAAGGAATGIAVIAGTGSAAWGITADGREARSGGWGYLLGDEGSGYWLTREAIRRTLHRFNLAQKAGELGRRILEANAATSPSELIGLFHSDLGRRHWASQSPVVFAAAAAGDDEARSLIETAGADLAGLVADIVSVIGVPGPVVIGGGLAVHQPALQEAIRRPLAAAGVTDVRFLTQDPVLGADFLRRTRSGRSAAGEAAPL
ncbi:N-acetylglucosamine kinase [uncultured Arthrobacter sp.]|uniref:N-acetylglucosamine kinase n=1 Tax=uncultured Arthrobacter sp. TaxID=114050 RepID=UPI0025F21E7C|nr:BadF/BadG/BcrA/BcrD ATPase family protein [uncultured Arthrobacter sp.]